MRHSRRTFLKLAGGGVAAGAVAAVAGLSGKAPADDAHEAMFYRKLDGRRVQCLLCPRACEVPEGGRGFCRVRENRAGVYRTLVYNKVCTANVDPIEKKPLFHYLPATTALSIATAGCNIACKFCQNWNISQVRPEDIEHEPTTPAKLVRSARDAGAQSIAFTYSEPTVFYEMMHDTAAEFRRSGLGAVTISNGYIQADPLRELAKSLTAYKVDLKAFTEEFYRTVTSGSLKPVKDTLVLAKSLGLWLEIVVLVIPTLNDKAEDVKAMTAWIRKELGPDVPVHFTRFHPTYQMKNLPPTPVKTLERCRQLGLDAGLNFVYLGNVPGHEGESTYCPGCQTTLIKRYGFQIEKNHLKNGTCPKCARAIPGVWSLAQGTSRPAI